MRSSIDPDEARRAARDILSGAEYSPPEESPIERVVTWIFDRLGDAIGTLTGGGPGSVIGWVIVLALGGGAVWLLVRSLQVAGILAAPDHDGVQYGTESSRDATPWLDEAERLAAGGDHRGAIRCRYQALLATLITENVVGEVPGRTSGEYRDCVGDLLPEVRDVVDDVTTRFEDAWYGDVPVGADDFAAVADACSRIESAATRSSVHA